MAGALPVSDILMAVLTRSRIIALFVVLVVAALAYTAWLVFQVRSDLSDAQSSADALQTALEDDDEAAREAALGDFQDAAADAADHTDGIWWSAMTYMPIVGDDAAGVRALSTSLDTVARVGAAPSATPWICSTTSAPTAGSTSTCSSV